MTAARTSALKGLGFKLKAEGWDRPYARHTAYPYLRVRPSGKGWILVTIHHDYRKGCWSGLYEHKVLAKTDTLDEILTATKTELARRQHRSIPKTPKSERNAAKRKASNP